MVKLRFWKGSKVYKCILVIFFTAVSFGSGWAHEGESHKEGSDNIHEDNIGSSSPPKHNTQAYKRISAYYQKNIIKILKKACFDCHSETINYPSYYKIPGIKQLIDRDIKNAKEHLVFTEKFPFKSHESPESDLSSILKSIVEKRMPPERYAFMHKKNQITDNEILQIKAWVNFSLKELSQ